MSNYWKDRAAAAVVEKLGALVVVPGYPEWSFNVKPINDWATDYHRAVARVAALPGMLAAVERVRSPEYVETEDDRLFFEDAQASAFADGCLASWNVTAEDGSPMPLTNENARRLLGTFPDIYRHLKDFARTPENFKPMTAADKIAAVAGNSQRASNTARVRGAKRLQSVT